jgi:hypothetical protein
VKIIPINSGFLKDKKVFIKVKAMLTTKIKRINGKRLKED